MNPSVSLKWKYVSVCVGRGWQLTESIHDVGIMDNVGDHLKSDMSQLEDGIIEIAFSVHEQLEVPKGAQ